jgi:Ca2+-binding RTX toxin-like protein
MSDPNVATPVTAALAGLDLADAALGGPAARSTYGVSGAGIKIGIMSDSYDVNGGAAAAIQDGLLPPAGVTVLEEGPRGSSDEGQAMAELIHATAPAAQLYFYTAFNSEQDFANGMQALAAAGCQIIVDDIAWVDEPFFQLAGPVDTGAAAVVAKGVSYFSAAGNEGNNDFQGAFSPATTDIPGIGSATAEQFPGGSFFQTATIPAGEQVTLSLQWDAPYDAANPATLTVDAIGPGGSVTTSFQPGQEPAALLNFPTLSSNAAYSIYVTQTPGTTAPSLFKYVLEGGGTLTGQGVGVGSGSIIGHDLVPGVNAVGAVAVNDTPAEGGTPTPEPYSSTGPGEFLFSPNGAALSQPQTLDAPAFLAPDGAATSVINPFYGTSAAAAEAAAVAALVLQADPSLTNGDVSRLLADSAIPAGPASAAGAGLIQAAPAVRYAETRQISGSTQPTVLGISQACTLTGGTGTQELVAGTAPTLLDAPGTDTVVAGAGADTVALTGAAALLFGGGGTLLVDALAGQDTVVGGSGSLTVTGGSGGGFIYGSAAGDNRLTAGSAPTWLVQGGAADTLVAAGGGNDTLFAAGSGAATLIGGGSAGDVFADAATGSDLILPGGGTSPIFLGAGAATVAPGTGRVLLQGGAGAVEAFGGTAGGNVLTAGGGAATLVGGGAGDRLTGDGAGDLLIAAGGGNDTLIGGSGQESLVGTGGTGADIFLPGAADAVIAPQAAPAVIEPGSGQTTVAAGTGAELLDFVAGTAGGRVFVVGFDPARDMLQLDGYGSAAGAAAVAAQQEIGGSAWLTLPDGTTVAFVGLAHLGAANVVTA